MGKHFLFVVLKMPKINWLNIPAPVSPAPQSYLRQESQLQLGWERDSRCLHISYVYYFDGFSCRLNLLYTLIVCIQYVFILTHHGGLFSLEGVT